MSCDRCRDFLLEADSNLIARALGGSGPAGPREPGPYAGPGLGTDDESLLHLARCDECRRLALLILDHEERLAAALSGVRSETPLPVAVARAATAARSRRRNRRTRLIVASAAVLVGLIGFGVMERETGRLPTRRTVGHQLASLATGVSSMTPDVEAQEGQSVAVFEMPDEDVVVFWFYEGRGP